jgi:hypothetical protein
MGKIKCKQHACVRTFSNAKTLIIPKLTSLCALLTNSSMLNQGLGGEHQWAGTSAAALKVLARGRGGRLRKQPFKLMRKSYTRQLPLHSSV